MTKSVNMAYLSSALDISISCIHLWMYLNDRWDWAAQFWMASQEYNKNMNFELYSVT